MLGFSASMLYGSSGSLNAMMMTVLSGSNRYSRARLIGEWSRNWALRSDVTPDDRLQTNAFSSPSRPRQGTRSGRRFDSPAAAAGASDACRVWACIPADTSETSRDRTPARAMHPRLAVPGFLAGWDRHY